MDMGHIQIREQDLNFIELVIINNIKEQFKNKQLEKMKKTNNRFKFYWISNK